MVIGTYIRSPIVKLRTCNCSVRQNFCDASNSSHLGQREGLNRLGMESQMEMVTFVLPDLGEYYIPLFFLEFPVNRPHTIDATASTSFLERLPLSVHGSDWIIGRNCYDPVNTLQHDSTPATIQLEQGSKRTPYPLSVEHALRMSSIQTPNRMNRQKTPPPKLSICCKAPKRRSSDENEQSSSCTSKHAQLGAYKVTEPYRPKAENS